MSKKSHRITGMELPLELGIPEVMDAFPNYVMLVDQNHHISGLWVSSAVYPTGFRTQRGQTIFLHTVYDITAKARAEDELRRHYETQRVLNSLLQLSLKIIQLDSIV